MKPASVLPDACRIIQKRSKKMKIVIAERSASGIISHPPARISEPRPIVSGLAASCTACNSIIFYLSFWKNVILAKIHIFGIILHRGRQGRFGKIMHAARRPPPRKRETDSAIISSSPPSGLPEPAPGYLPEINETVG